MIVNTKNKIQSNYLYIARVYKQCEKILKTNITSWGVYIENNFTNHTIKNTGNTEEDVMKAEILYIMNSNVINQIIKNTNENLTMLKKYDIDAIYQIEIDFTKRYFYDKDHLLKEDRKTITYTIKYYNKLGTILTDGYSSGLEEFNIDDIKTLLYSKITKLSMLAACKSINYIPDYIYLCFSPFTAAIVNHELFGHLFEIDNYKKFINQEHHLYIPENIAIYDCPNKSLGGYCSFDDYGNILYPEKIIDKGKVFSLITDSNISGSVRGRAGTKYILPRLTNTIVEVSKKIDIDFFEAKTIFVQGITQALLRDNSILLTIDSSFINIEKSICKLPLIKINIKVQNILNGIVGFWGNNSQYSTVDCIKKKQRCGGIGISSPGMILKTK